MIYAARIVLVLFYSIIMASAALLVSPFVRKGNVYHAVGRGYARGILFMCGVKLKVEGLEHVDLSHNFIYVANHASYLDIPVVFASIPAQIRIIYKKELHRIPLFGWGLKLGRTYIAIDRRAGQDAMESLEAAARKIRDGASVIMFGEGTRTHDGNLQQFKRGPFNLAVKAGVPIVPVTINGSYAILPRHSWKIRPGTISVVVGRPISPARGNGKSTEIELRDLAQSEIRKNFRKDV